MHTIALEHIQLHLIFHRVFKALAFSAYAMDNISMKHTIEPREVSLHVDGLNPSSNYHKRTISAQRYDERAQSLH